jgi:hypothetical protein
VFLELVYSNFEHKDFIILEYVSNMIEIGPYPTESGLFPTHFYIALATVVIFFFMLFIKNFYKVDIQSAIPLRRNVSNRAGAGKAAETKETALSAANLLTLGTLLFSLITFFAAPLFNSPLLDYKVTGPFSTDKAGINYVRIDMTNTGIKEATNVLLSYNAPNVTFRGYETQPLLPKSEAFGSRGDNQTGEAYLQINSTPPGSTTTVFENVRSEDSNETQKFTTYLRSQQGVAYFNVAGIIIFYLVLSLIYGASAYIFWFYPSSRSLVTIFAIMAIVVVLILGPYWHDCSFNFNKCAYEPIPGQMSS